jgi:hypothetical protein
MALCPSFFEKNSPKLIDDAHSVPQHNSDNIFIKWTLGRMIAKKHSGPLPFFLLFSARCCGETVDCEKIIPRTPQ